MPAWDSRVVCLSFFFQAEDGIRDLTVTGVQTCALPIYVFFVAAVDTHVHFNVAVFVFERARSTWDELNGFDVADFDAIEFDGSALGEARDFGKKSFEAIFGAEDACAGDVEDAGGENGEADENEKPDAEFRPGELFSLRHLSWPPECDD